eukprot:TRINITY_DN2771_c0_g1_i2.p1 TRINITY_DN2771_c0_g1~~TRINITY_DN2771_c0_g1_i2.p1  ORF type:complete len:134 (+),score=8.91 TRINITY_DN2771_c0_g1_i2:1-402(+)
MILIFGAVSILLTWITTSLSVLWLWGPSSFINYGIGAILVELSLGWYASLMMRVYTWVPVSMLFVFVCPLVVEKLFVWGLVWLVPVLYLVQGFWAVLVAFVATDLLDGFKDDAQGVANVRVWLVIVLPQFVVD